MVRVVRHTYAQYRLSIVHERLQYQVQEWAKNKLLDAVDSIYII
jgi:hypothetical protein